MQQPLSAEYRCLANDVILVGVANRPSDVEELIAMNSAAVSVTGAAERQCASAPGERLTWFRPTYTHQVISDDQVIHGYRGLRICLLYTPSFSASYLSITWLERARDSIDVRMKITAMLPEQQAPCAQLGEFIKAVEEETLGGAFEPPGTQVHAYLPCPPRFSCADLDEEPPTSDQPLHQPQQRPAAKLSVKEALMRAAESGAASLPASATESGCEYVVRYADLAGDAAARRYHAGVQPLVMWLIDNANYINPKDPGWHLALLYRKQPADTPGKYRYTLLGFTSVYHFYHPWDKTRVRISQFLILPPYQRMGHAIQLLRAVYNVARGDPNIVDVTVEDASDEMTRVRDLTDLFDLRDAGLWPTLENTARLDQPTVALIQQKFKLCKVQINRCHSVLRFKHAKESNDASVLRQIRLHYKSALYQTLMQHRAQQDATSNPASPAREVTTVSRITATTAPQPMQIDEPAAPAAAGSVRAMAAAAASSAGGGLSGLDALIPVKERTKLQLQQLWLVSEQDLADLVAVVQAKTA
eukprot:TRINITY_DN5641_c0_g1_i1.p1 TRINITY_DN5641_c0_g1~~TRINITY_DN5641_c0_g1_i1.p1  ORF type:complete len:542 (+),score=129.28 TRINITY_DN5641_c0_g1_i1:40-1626(+)